MNGLGGVEAEGVVDGGGDVLRGNSIARRE